MKFQAFVASAPAAAPLLPLVHTCDGYSFMKILDAGVLNPSKCRVFNENLLYFFYGRPAYRPKSNGGAIALESAFPVCFVVDAAAVETPKRVYPFDTGAFTDGRFDAHLNPRMTREDFALVADLQSPSRVVSKFFGTNRAYYDSKPVNAAIPPTEMEAGSYASMISSKGTEPFDDRCATVEVQGDAQIQLDAGGLRAIVMPAGLGDDPDVRSRVTNDFKAELLPYMTFRAEPIAYAALLHDKVGGFLARHDYLS